MLVTTTVGTLGFTDAQFLWGYGTLCAIGAIGVWQERRRVLGPATTRRDPQPELGPYRLAIMGAGADRATTAAAAQLCRDGRLQASGGTLTTTSAPALTDDALEREVLEAVAREPGLSIELLHARVRDSEAMAAMTEQMTRTGLLLEPAQARRLRLLWIVPALLAAIGVAGLLGGADDNAGSAYVLLAIVAAAVVATVRLVRVRTLATNRGQGLLDRQRRVNASKRRHPVAGEAGLMTALYGGGGGGGGGN